MNDEVIERMLLTTFKGAEPPPQREEIKTQAQRLATAIRVKIVDIDKVIKSVESKLITTMNEGVSLIDREDDHDKEWALKKKGINWEYWNDYKSLLEEERWAPKVIHTIGEVTSKILGLLKNPETQGQWDRRGLVIGHVQSGKTANYIGLLAKAADTGYRFIIVIAGIHNNLRTQTQARIDKGFIGRDGETKEIIGVGELNRNRAFPIPLTNTSSDFSKNTAGIIPADLDAYSSDRPIILVIKKRVSTLQYVYSSLRQLNADRKGQISKTPMLLIDDEADNASINTNKPENDPTKTNEEIRKLLKLFNRSCYVGYTATPFANIFINPDSDEEMIGEDLFPKNFIYSLDAPANYFGAQKVFLEDEYSQRALKVIDDAEDYIPFSHKKMDEIIDLPGSAKEAIMIFILARVIRILRKQSDKHCSMLINVSRFVDIQRQIKEHVSFFLTRINEAVRYNYAMPPDMAMKNQYLFDLKNLFEKEYKHCDETWINVQQELPNAIEDIRIFLVNSKAEEKLDYSAYEKSGRSLTAIAIGGLSLSRGLTIEGLVVSYLYRNTKMYDTLMQMGRWFGYRPGYEDLCRIYLSDESQGWYAHIAEATDELQQQIRLMHREDYRPVDFGLYVRAHPDTLIVTALNKMRLAERRTLSISYDGKLKETHILPESERKKNANLSTLRNFYNHLGSIKSPEKSEGSLLWKGVSFEDVLTFVEDFKFHEALEEDQMAFLKYARTVSDKYQEWDVAFISLKNEKAEKDEIIPMAIQERRVGTSNTTEKNINRKIKRPPGEPGWYVGNKQRISGKGVEKVGLDVTQLNEAEKNAHENNRKKPTDVDFRTVRGTPLLMLHLLDLVAKQNKSEKELLCSKVPALGFSFPFTGDTRSVDYIVNRVWIEQDMYDHPDEEDDNEL